MGNTLTVSKFLKLFCLFQDGSRQISASVVSSTSSGSSSGRVNMAGGGGGGTGGAGGSSGMNPGGPGVSAGAVGAPTEEDELTIPRAAMNKMLKVDFYVILLDTMFKMQTWRKSNNRI